MEKKKDGYDVFRTIENDNDAGVMGKSSLRETAEQ